MNNLSAELKELLLGPPRLTLAAAESLTCGHVQAGIGAASGASSYFRGGVTAYTLDAKVSLLGVDRGEAERTNCVSAGVAEQMARGACARFGADLAVATTGYAEPAPDKNVSAPFAWWALAHREATTNSFRAVHSGRLERPGLSRLDVQGSVATAVLIELRDYLRELRAGRR